MPEPMRIQLRRTKGWRKPPNTVSCARPAKYGNPYRWTDYNVANADDTPAPPDVQRRVGTQMALRDHKAWLYLNDKHAEIRRDLANKHLACWCRVCVRHKDGKPWNEPCRDCDPCHVDHLLEVANGTPLVERVAEALNG